MTDPRRASPTPSPAADAIASTAAPAGPLPAIEGFWWGLAKRSFEAR